MNKLKAIGIENTDIKIHFRYLNIMRILKLSLVPY